MTDPLSEKIEILRPKPSPAPLIRIGGKRDGAYLLPDDLENIKACFSPGVANRKNFEDELMDRFGIPSHMCDYSSDLGEFKTELRSGQTFLKKWLDVDGGEHSISLEDWVSELAPSPGDDLILQMDIEGAEYRNLLQTPDAVLRRFRIMCIELHSLKDHIRPDDFDRELGPFLQRIDKYFICVHAHPNNCCGDFQLTDSNLNLPVVHELTFLRRDRWQGISETDCYPPMLPHPQDIEYNVRSNPPVFLNEHWLASGSRTHESTVKLLTDQVNYLSRALEQAQVPVEPTNQELLTELHCLAQHVASALPTPSPRPEQETLVDLAADKPFTLSSQHGACPTSRNVSSQQPFFFHTRQGFNQWITIDLENESLLFELRITNRSDACRDRAHCLFYCLHQKPDTNFHQGFPIAVDEKFLTKADQISVTDLRGCQSRYVTIFSPAETYLHFSSVQILGRCRE